MKIGAVYPQNELGGSAFAFTQFGKAAEDVGFDLLLLYDHVLGAQHENRTPPLAGPYTEKDPFHDPFVAFGYLAGITRRIEFFTGILVLPQRQTALVARQAADVDLFSAGRLTLGVGVGWNPVEYQALGQRFETRGKRMEEQMAVLRKLWSDELVDWEGQFERIDRAALCPRPGRQIMLYCGGFVESAFRRAARIGDGFIFGGQTVDGLIPQWAKLQEMLREEGRTAPDFGAHALIINDRFAALGVADAADAVRRWRDAGGTHASIVCSGQGFTDVTQHLDYLGEVLNLSR